MTKAATLFTLCQISNWQLHINYWESPHRYFCKSVACHDQIDLNNIDQAVDYKINDDDDHHFVGLQTCKNRIKVCERFAQTCEEPIIHFSTFYVLL